MTVTNYFCSTYDWTALKSRIKTRLLAVFLIDQAAHIGFLVALSIWVAERYRPALFWASLFGETWTRWLIILAGAVAAIQAGSVLIGLAVDPLLKEIAQDNGTEMSQNAKLSRGLKKGGKLIGQPDQNLGNFRGQRFDLFPPGSSLYSIHHLFYSIVDIMEPKVLSPKIKDNFEPELVICNISIAEFPYPKKEIDLVSPNSRGCLFLTSPRIAFYHR
jgi:hypothetical protein